MEKEQTLRDKIRPDSVNSSQGDIPPGYKKTEVGVIPEDWDLCSIEKICSRITDGEHLTPKRAENGILLLSARNVHNGYLLLDDVDFFLEPEYLKFKKRVNPESGDLLISCSGTIGRICVVPGNLLFGLVRSVAIIKPIKELIESKYLMFLFQFDIVQKQIQKSQNQLAQANLFQGQIRQLIIPCPLKKEQIAIAAALSDADGLIGALETLIAKKRAIKQATMQQLLTGKTRLPGFAKSTGYKKTEVGVIPEDWGVERIDNHATITTGSKNTQDRVEDGEYPFFVRSQQVERINSYSYEGEAVLTAGDGVGTGKVFHYINGPFDLHQRVYRISDFSNRLNGYYFFYQFKTRFFDRIMAMTAKSSVDSVRMEMIAGMLISLPSIAEQHAIATVLSDMDAEITALEQRLDKAQQIKQGMMQQLLTGKVRLVTPQEAEAAA